MTTWFGYEPLDNSVLAWGARTIFHHGTDLPLETLWDRQGHLFDPATQEDAYRQFASYINKTVLPKLQEVANYYDPSDHSLLVLHFDWPHDPDLLVVAMGSPKGSYGYFYLSVNLVPKEGAPEVVLPRGYAGAAKPRASQRNGVRGR